MTYSKESKGNKSGQGNKMRVQKIDLFLLVTLYVFCNIGHFVVSDDFGDYYDDMFKKVGLKIAIALKKHAFHQRPYSQNLKSGLKSGSNDVFYLETTHYKTGFVEFENYSPREILDGICKTLELKVSTLIYMSRIDFEGETIAAAKYFAQIANSIGIPIIIWTPDNPGLVAQDDEESLNLATSPSMTHQALAMLSILKRYKWLGFSIVTTATVGANQFVNTLRKIVEEDVDGYSTPGEKHQRMKILETVHMRELDTDSINKQLMKIKNSDTRIILFNALFTEAEKIFKVATDLGLTSTNYLWLVTKGVVGRTEGTELSFQSSPNANYPVGLLGISFKTSNEVGNKAAKIAGTIWSRAISNLAKIIGQNETEAATFVPDVNCKDIGKRRFSQGRVLKEFMMNATDPATGEKFFKDDGTLRKVKLDIVNLKEGSTWSQVGTWTTEKLDMKDITWPGKRTQPPDWRPAKYQMRVLTLEEEPFIVYDNPDNVTGKCAPRAQICRVAPQNVTIGVANATTNSSLYKCCSGFCIDLLRQLSNDLNFDVELSQVEDKIWGVPDKKGNWNGLPRALMDGKGDMVMTSLKINPERSSVVDFSVPFLETGITIIVAIRDGAISPTAFLEPYDYPSWCLILVFSVHATGAAIFIFDWLSPDGMNQGRTPIREHRFSLFRAFWLIWAMLFAASVNTDNPRGVSGRFLASVWALFAVVFLASYTANLAAFMIAKEVYYDLSGIQDMRLKNPYAYKPPFRFATMPNGSTEINLKKNYPIMYDYMRPFNQNSVDDGIKATKAGDIDAFIYDASVLEYKASHDESCKLRTVGKWYAMTGYGVAFPKGSKWLHRVNKLLTRLQHDGTLERLRKFWLRGACKDNEEKGDKSHPLEIKNFTSAFILLAGGMLLGVVLLLLEHMYFKFIRPKLRKWDRGGYCGLISLSMGKSLTFQESVLETTEMIKHHHCKNPLCETQIWKARHELDLALMKIERLNETLMDYGIEPPAIAWSKEVGQTRGHYPNNLQPRDGRPPSPGFNVGIEKATPPYPMSDPLPLPEPPDSWLRARMPDAGGNRSSEWASEPSVDVESTPDSVHKKFRSQPSPNKKPPTSMPAWKGEESDDLLIQRSNSKNDAGAIVDTNDDDEAERTARKRKHRGNVYVGLKDDSFSLEKETVL